MNPAINIREKYTYADYLNWPDDERWELIDGYPYAMSPAPVRKHQDILLQLARKISDFFDDSSCRVYVAPFDVRLAEDYSDDHLINNVVQPDISVFCNKGSLDDKGAMGPPTLAVEILSPSTAQKDVKTKLLLYQKYEVEEYWIVDPVAETVEILILDDTGKYNPGEVFSEKLSSSRFEDLSIDLKGLFNKIRD